MASEVNLRRAVSDGLVARGFKRAGRTLIQRLGQEWALWVDTGPLGNRGDITPFVGLRNDRVEELFASFLGVPHDKYVGTVGANVGYVLDGKVRTWSDSSQPEEVIQAVLAALDRFRPYLSLEELSRAWELKGTGDPGKLYRLVVVAILLKDRAEVVRRLDDARRVFCAAQNAVCEQFRGFEARALEYFERQAEA